MTRVSSRPRGIFESVGWDPTETTSADGAVSAVGDKITGYLR